MPRIISRKQEIRHVAERMFRERGYSATSMRELAKAVGMEAPSLYNHYNSKEALLNDICFGMADSFFRAFKDAVSVSDRAVDQLRAAMLAHISIIASQMESADVFFKEWNGLSEPERTRFKTLRTEYENGFRALIRKGMEDGSIIPGNDKLIVFTLLSAMNAVCDLLRSRSGLTASGIGPEMCDMLLQGIQTKSR